MTPSTTELQLVAYSVDTALNRLSDKPITIVCCVSTRVEVALAEMKIEILNLIFLLVITMKSNKGVIPSNLKLGN